MWFWETIPWNPNYDAFCTSGSSFCRILAYHLKYGYNSTILSNTKVPLHSHFMFKNMHNVLEEYGRIEMEWAEILEKCFSLFIWLETFLYIFLMFFFKMQKGNLPHQWVMITRFKRRQGQVWWPFSFWVI